MNYYDQIKGLLISNEIYKKVKDYSKNKNDLETYYNVGKLLFEAGNKYGERIIKEYSQRLIEDLNKKYSIRYLFDMRKLYEFSKVHPLGAQLTMSHYRLLFPFKNNKGKVDYLINQVIKRNLSKRDLETIITNKEYERLPIKSRSNNSVSLKVGDEIKNPIIINNKEIINDNDMKESILKRMIMEDIDNFLSQLGNGFTYVGNEYKIRIGDTFNYIDILLYNYIYNCFVVVELKVTELKKEHIGQIMIYMNYIDDNIKQVTDNKTIGLIIVKEDNKYIIKYSSDKRIKAVEYKINNQF